MTASHPRAQPLRVDHADEAIREKPCTEALGVRSSSLLIPNPPSGPATAALLRVEPGAQVAPRTGFPIHELGAAAPSDDPLRALPCLVELPMQPWILAQNAFPNPFY